MSGLNVREVAEGLLVQGEDEEIAYTIDVSAVDSSPSPVSVMVKNTTSGEDVTDETMPVNELTADGGVITLSPLGNLTRGNYYRVEVLWSDGSGNTLENYFRVLGQE